MADTCNLLHCDLRDLDFSKNPKSGKPDCSSFSVQDILNLQWIGAYAICNTMAGKSKASTEYWM